MHSQASPAEHTQSPTCHLNAHLATVPPAMITQVLSEQPCLGKAILKSHTINKQDEVTQVSLIWLRRTPRAFACSQFYLQFRCSRLSASLESPGKQTAVASPLWGFLIHLGYEAEHLQQPHLRYTESEFHISPLCPWEVEGKTCCWRGTQ